MEKIIELKIKYWVATNEDVKIAGKLKKNRKLENKFEDVFEFTAEELLKIGIAIRSISGEKNVLKWDYLTGKTESDFKKRCSKNVVRFEIDSAALKI